MYKQFQKRNKLQINVFSPTKRRTRAPFMTPLPIVHRWSHSTNRFLRIISFQLPIFCSKKYYIINWNISRSTLMKYNYFKKKQSPRRKELLIKTILPKKESPRRKELLIKTILPKKAKSPKKKDCGIM